MLAAGEMLGDWVVVEPLGEGGMGTVFLCHSQLSEDVQAAVKVVKSHGLGDFERRFVDEMRTVAALNHPSIVSVRSGGVDRDRGLLYMGMELIDGGDLEQHMKKGPMPMEEVRRIFAPIADALAFAHGRGVHHRDLKPANIMLRESGPPVLVDFGIAVAKDRTRLTTDGMVPGTAAYMAPEVFRGQNPELALGDIYALGVVLWEALTGRHAFWIDGDMSDGQRLFQVVGLKVQSEPLDPGVLVPDEIRQLVRGMTHPDPEQRLRDLGEVTRALAATQPGPRSDAEVVLFKETTWVNTSPASAMREEAAEEAAAEASVEQPVVVSAPPPADHAGPFRRRRGWTYAAGLAAAGVAVVCTGLGAVALGLAAFAMPAMDQDAVYEYGERDVVVVLDADADDITIEEVAEPIDEDPGVFAQRTERKIERRPVRRPVRRVVKASDQVQREAPAVVEVEPEIEPVVVIEPEVVPEPEVEFTIEPEPEKEAWKPRRSSGSRGGYSYGGY